MLPLLRLDVLDKMRANCKLQWALEKRCWKGVLGRGAVPCPVFSCQLLQLSQILLGPLLPSFKHHKNNPSRAPTPESPAWSLPVFQHARWCHGWWCRPWANQVPPTLVQLGRSAGEKLCRKANHQKKQHHADQLHFFYFFLLFGVRKKQRFGVEKAAICSEQPRFVSWPFSYMKVALVSK